VPLQVRVSLIVAALSFLSAWLLWRRAVVGRRPRTQAETDAAYALESGHPSPWVYTPAAKRAGRAAYIAGGLGWLALIALYLAL
jgi:hypothetical protein